MNFYDEDIFRELLHNLADLGVKEDDTELIQIVARQWTQVVPETTPTDFSRLQPAEFFQTKKPRDRPLRVLIVSYRFDPKIVGGAEFHTWMLARLLRQAGIEVDVFTTRNSVFRPTSSYGIIWENNSPEGMVEIDGFKVHRFTNFNLPLLVSRGISYWIRRRRDREDSRIDSSLSVGAHLGIGWHGLERGEQGVPFRWMARKKARVILADEDVSGISMEVFCPKRLRGSLERGKDREQFDVSPGEWKLLELTFEPRSKPCVMLRVQRLWKQQSDPRWLGLAVRDIRYRSGNHWRTLHMERDLQWALGELDGERVVDIYRQLTAGRPLLYDWLYMLARGPLAPGMYAQLYKQMPHYDAVIANMIPFNTLCFAAWAGKRRNVPVLLLPLMHHRDHYHHWGHFYRAMGRSAAILANSRFSECLFRKLGYKAVFAGAGVDKARYTKLDIWGQRFRRKFGLDSSPIALFVGRKTQYKRCDMAVDAVDMVNARGNDLLLVTIGPDEDGVPIRSPYTVPLGKVSNRDLLDAYDACDLFVLPSELESFGMVYLEAWMRKKPVIGLRRCDAVASLIEDGVNGFLCSDAEEIAERMAYLLDNPAEAQLMGIRGFQKTIENYTWESVGRRIIQVLEKIC
ncbi:MAG: glycosyltransferase [Deltaproteobacteria bacterium]|nr:glycosyltransferase [Deltaproteobacteria bacterium]